MMWCARSTSSRLFLAHGLSLLIVSNPAPSDKVIRLASGRASIRVEVAIASFLAFAVEGAGGLPLLRHTFAIDTPTGRVPFFRAPFAFAQLDLALIWWLNR